MLKQYKILVNEAKGAENVLVNVPVGAAANENPVRIVAKPNARYELQDGIKGKGLAPDQVRVKRVGQSLYLMLDNSVKPDVIIEGYYESANQSKEPTLVGKAENGWFYEYTPHDPELSSLSSTLKEGSTPTMLSLGGAPLAADSFELSALPLVAAAASGGLGGLGWVAAGLGAAALAGGGGGAKPEKRTLSKPVVKIETDSDGSNAGNGDGIITSAEIGTATTVSVSATFADKTNLKVGDKLRFTDTVSGATQDVTLDWDMVNSGKVMTTFARPKDGKSLSVSAVLTDAAQTLSLTSNVDTAQMAADTSPPTPLGNGLDGHLKKDATNDTGASQSDGITQTKMPVLVGQVEANADVSVLVNGVTYTTKADANGNYAIAVTNALDDGPYTPVITITDASGNSTTVNGTPFYVDNKSDVNQSPTKNLPDSNTAATVDITSISDDTLNAMDVFSTASDFVTRDNTLIYTGKVATFDNNGDYVKLELKDSKGEVVATDYLKPNNLAWTWDRTSVTQADGKYTLEASVVDAAGNRVNTTAAGVDTQTIYISNQSLQAVADNDQDVAKSPGLVKAVERGFNVAGSNGTGNVLANDKNEALGYAGDQSRKTVKLIDSVTKNLVGSLVGQYGTLTLQSNGDYSYTPDNAKQMVERLGAGKMLSETFNYEVTDATGATSQSTLSVSVVGSNDKATLTIGGASPFISNWYDQPFKIFVNDADANEGSFLQPSQANLMGAFGSFKVSNESNQWSYRAKDSYTPLAGKTVHDLLVITSLDGASSGVIDVKLEGTGPITQQEFNVKTSNGLNTITGTTTTFDILKINGDGQTLDLTLDPAKALGLTSQLSSIEKIDLSQTAINKLVINLDDLVQTDQRALYVDGSSNSSVSFVHGNDVVVKTGPTTSYKDVNYKTYLIHDIQDSQTIYSLLLQTAMPDLIQP